MYRDVRSIVSLAAFAAFHAGIAPRPVVPRVVLSLALSVAGGLPAPVRLRRDLRAWAQLPDRSFDEAIRDFTELHRRSRHPDAMLGRGLAHHSRRRTQDAREDFRSAEVLNRDTRGRNASRHRRQHASRRHHGR